MLENVKRFILVGLCAVLVIAGSIVFGRSVDETKMLSEDSVHQHWGELFQVSQKEKKGLTFFVEGQTIPGIVTNIIGDEAVEVRNQTNSRVIIRMESIDAVALN